MRHGKRFNHLGRKKGHRRAMLANMACSLIEHKRINTTVAKAKALRQYVEPLITKSKSDSTHSRRMVFKYLQSKDAVSELFREVAPKIAEREGGYTRIIKTGHRLGDSADMCLIELVDFNDLYSPNDDKSSGKKRTRRGGAKKKSATTAVTDAVSEAKDVASDAAQKVENTAQNVAENVADKAEEVAEAAESTVEEVKDKVSEVAEDAKEKAEDAVEEVKDKVADATESSDESEDDSEDDKKSEDKA